MKNASHQNLQPVKEDRLHQLRRAEDVLAQDLTDCSCSLVNYEVLGELSWNY